MSLETVDMNALTNALTTIVDTIQDGNERARDALAGITDILGIIEIVMWGASVLLGSEALAAFVKKFLGLQIWLWIIRGFHGLAKAFLKSLVAGAFSAAGSGGSMKTLLDPSKIAATGLNATEPLAQHIEALGKLQVGDKVILGIIFIIIMLCFILMAVNVAWAVIEFYIFLNLSGLLIPFALMPQTRFIADKGINAVLACTIKLAVYAFVVGLISPLLANIDFHKTFGPGDKTGMNWNDIWSMMAVVVFCLGLCLRAPQLAAGLIHGSPTMSGTAMVMGAAAGAVALGGKAAMGLGNAIFGSAQALSDFGDRYLGGSSGGGNKKDSPMSEATKAGTMAPNTPAGAGVLYGFAYYPASGQLGAPAPNALPADIIDAMAEPLGLPAQASQPQPPALPGA